MAIKTGGTPQSVHISSSDVDFNVDLTTASINANLRDGSGTPVVSQYGSLPVILSPMNLDASGRLRVGSLITLGDYKSIDSDNTLYYDIQGTGTKTHSSTDAWYALSVTAGQWAVMQTYQFHNYASGKSHLPEFTFIGFQPETDVIKRAGYFSSSTSSPFDTAYDGIYLESSNGTVKLVINRIGTPTATIEQANWDDPLDGTGVSGKVVNWANFLPIFIDFLWLGGTRVRLWVVIDGELILAHTYSHSNNQPFTMIRQPSQPIRFEIRSAGGSGSFYPVCAAVSTEGALSPVGTIRSANNGANQCDADVSGTEYAVLGIRLKSANRHDSIDIVDVNCMAATSDDFLWQLKLNPTVAGTFTYNDIAGSSIQYAIGDTPNTITGGYVVASSYAQGNSVASKAIESARRLGSTLAGVMDQLVITVIPLSNGLDIYGTLTWRELR